jgi:hypothetical protein
LKYLFVASFIVFSQAEIQSRKVCPQLGQITFALPVKGGEFSNFGFSFLNNEPVLSGC